MTIETMPATPAPESLSIATASPSYESIDPGLTRLSGSRGVSRVLVSASWPELPRASIADLWAFLASREGRLVPFDFPILTFVPNAGGGTSGFLYYRTNNVRRNDEMVEYPWVNDHIALGASTEGPYEDRDGDLVAYAWTSDGAGTPSLRQNMLDPWVSGDNNLSAYFKYLDATYVRLTLRDEGSATNHYANFRWQAGVLNYYNRSSSNVGYGVVGVGGGWYRAYIRVNGAAVGATGNGMTIYVHPDSNYSSGNTGSYVWGIQQEPATVPFVHLPRVEGDAPGIENPIGSCYCAVVFAGIDPFLKAGDYVSIEGLAKLYAAAEDATQDQGVALAGTALVRLNSPIEAGDDGASVYLTAAAAKLRVTLQNETLKISARKPDIMRLAAEFIETYDPPSGT